MKLNIGDLYYIMRPGIKLLIFKPIAEITEYEGEEWPDYDCEILYWRPVPTSRNSVRRKRAIIMASTAANATPLNKALRHKHIIDTIFRFKNMVE